MKQEGRSSKREAEGRVQCDTYDLVHVPRHVSPQKNIIHSLSLSILVSFPGFLFRLGGIDG